MVRTYVYKKRNKGRDVIGEREIYIYIYIYIHIKKEQRRKYYYDKSYLMFRLSW